MTDKSDIFQEGLDTSDLTLRYGKTPALQELTLSLPPGQFTALLGPNGSGKSTLLRALARQQRAKSGQVLLNGQPLARIGSKQAARHLGLLPQGAVPPPGLSVEALVRQGRYPHRGALSPWSETDQKALDAALTRTGLDPLRHRALDTLSSGQRQRAWIAMVLAQQTPILLLDEPTAWLDLRHQIEILGLMRRLVDEDALTVIAALQDLAHAANYADHTVLLKEGRVEAVGSVRQVLRPNLLADVFGVEVDVMNDPRTGRPICLPRRVNPQ